MIRFVSAIFIFMFFLTACGGNGGKSSATNQMPMDTDGTPITPAGTRQALLAIGQKADSLIMSNLQTWYGDAGRSDSSLCNAGTRCTSGTDEFELIFTPENLSAIPRNANLQDRGTKQGVPLTEYSGTSTTALEFGSLSRPTSVDYHSLGGWMTYSFFAVNRWEFEPTGWQVWSAASLGAESGSNPTTGEATWTGAMVGRARGAGAYEPGDAVTGNSRLTFDFSSNTLDVALTEIRSGTNQSYADLLWSNVPVENGAFGSLGNTNIPDPTPPPGQPIELVGPVNDLQGSFYGPNHEEVGGVFQRDRMTGAFGGKR